MIECASCGEPLMDGTDRCESCGTERTTNASSGGTESLERGAFFLGLFGVIQATRIYLVPDVAWVQVTRGVMAAMGLALLIIYHRADISRWSRGAQMGLQAALALMALLLLVVWLG